ncbi:hypothetical protein [Campylobacter sp. RM16192]|uniref:hypothetical protein n=1 Tax=Campylobacter sp. RM16192 TaxID=1660080 RepID=UPI001F1B663B|nr:hypothetical protein [Campylobacter sp. RM16192]
MRFFKELGEILLCGNKDKKFAKFKRFYNGYKVGHYEIIDDGEILELKEPSYAKFCDLVEMKIWIKNQANKTKTQPSFTLSLISNIAP